jgi:hypothetical protein
MAKSLVNCNRIYAFGDYAYRKEGQYSYLTFQYKYES